MNWRCDFDSNLEIDAAPFDNIRPAPRDVSLHLDPVTPQSGFAGGQDGSTAEFKIKDEIAITRAAQAPHGKAFLL